MPDIYQSRDQILPYEYPEFEHFWESMYKGFWEFGKFDFERDVRDFKLELDDLEREILIRSMLSISVVENKVKSFWANCPQRFPKPEVFNVCYAFSSNEVVHQICYQKVLDLLKVYDRFEAVSEVDCMQGRVKYLNKYLDGAKSRSNKEFTKSLILFTLMTENVSLFSQFFIVSSFFKYKNVLNTFSKVITATMRDELLHGKFGSSLVNIVRKENPEWFDDEMEQKIRRNVRKAYKAELGVLDWIFEKGELSFISKKKWKNI
jgi:ribonucleoside-diphosphate reductase beta chain